MVIPNMASDKALTWVLVALAALRAGAGIEVVAQVVAFVVVVGAPIVLFLYALGS
jgi:hypothetical protein